MIRKIKLKITLARRRKKDLSNVTMEKVNYAPKFKYMIRERIAKPLYIETNKNSL